MVSSFIILWLITYAQLYDLKQVFLFNRNHLFVHSYKVPSIII